MVIRFCTDDEQSEVEALAKTDKEVAEFVYLWRLYRNWSKANPIVAQSDFEGVGIVGFHAVSFGVRSHYANSYYQFVSPDNRGNGVAGGMVALLLKEAIARECTRLKFKVPFGSDGERFWNGFGLKPFGKDDKHFLYDVNIENVETPKDLREAPCHWQCIPEKVLQQHVNKGVEVIV